MGWLKQLEKAERSFWLGIPLLGSSKGMKDLLPNKFCSWFQLSHPIWKVSDNWPFSRQFLICFSLTTMLFKVTSVDAHVNIKGEYTPKDRILLNSQGICLACFSFSLHQLLVNRVKVNEHSSLQTGGWRSGFFAFKRCVPYSSFVSDIEGRMLLPVSCFVS